MQQATMPTPSAHTVPRPQVTAYKATNPNLRVILSVGGWNFPSAYFSQMVASADSRAKFIASTKARNQPSSGISMRVAPLLFFPSLLSSSTKAYLAANNLDGVDLDWEFPCSPPRSDPVKITCTNFRSVEDAGGKCPDDGDNLLLLAQA